MKTCTRIFALFSLLAIPWSESPAQKLPEIIDTVLTPFGTYTGRTVAVIPAVKSYSVAPGLANVTVPAGLEFSAEAQAKLTANGFVAGTSRYAQMYDIYNNARNREIPLFITSDAMLHAFHILYDYTLRMMEVSYFYDAANQMTDLLLDKTEDYYALSADQYIRDILKRNMTYLSIAKELFDPAFTPDAGVEELVSAEVEFIHNRRDFAVSPLFGYIEDYSQYIPRGHYTRNETLGRYFRGMMWYGRMMFRLKPDGAGPANIAGRRETLQALYLIKALQEAQGTSGDAEELRGKVYYPTVFFVGKTDDLAAEDYLPLIREVYGKPVTSLSIQELADETSLTLFIDRAMELRNPMINSSWVGDWQDFQSDTKGFRLMGQRFIPDSYMLHKLSDNRVAGRSMPRGLDVMAVLGSERALAVLTEVFSQSDIYSDFLPALEKLRSDFHELDARAWAQNLYWNWLYVLDPLLWVKGPGYPFFMQNEAWQDKELHTALASWAELRHDTILYAKQSYSTTGVLPEVNPEQGYVEPNPHFFSRLAALAEFMRDGVTSRDLALEVFDRKLRDFGELSRSLTEIAVKELMNLTPSDEEFLVILRTPEKLEELTTFPPEIAGQIENDADDKMAVVADVHTDPTTGQVLEEAVGHPMPIYVVCPIGDRLVLTVGSVFSYYEFAHPLADRLTDEAWQEMLASGTQPERPPWTASFRDVSRAEHTGNFSHEEAYDLVASVKEPEHSKDDGSSTALMQNYPNPANPYTSFWYHLEPGGPFRVQLKVYNILGQEVRTLIDELQAGNRPYLTVWDGKDSDGITVASGVYIYVLKTERAVIAKKLVILM